MANQSTDPLLIDIQGHTECLLGNEAIVRGALEAGVAFAAGYPGTPSSEITDSFARVADNAGIVFEYSVNEKIALEMAFAASLAGARSICAMKHLGLMYAGDPLSTIPYVGTVAGMVIVSAGDPSCRTSPNEQDQRLLAPMLHIPVLDPSTPAEAYEMCRFAFELSEKCQLPVIMRPTTRVCHSRAVIEYGRLKRPQVKGFTKDPKRFVPIPVNARRLRGDLKRRLSLAEQEIAQSEFIRDSGQGKLAILASGAPAGTTADLLNERGLIDQLKFIVVGAVYPLPTERLLSALAGVERVLIVEELSPYLEDAILALCARHKTATEVIGKRSGHLPVEFEYEPRQIQKAIYTGLGLGPEPVRLDEPEFVPPRPPSLCPGCPHRASQYALRTVFGEEGLYFNDIGCYTLGYGPPLNTADALLCMGAGFSLAAGVARVTKQRTVGIMGDSTFFHSGMPALLNAIKENVNMVAVILDNHVTGMTGFQDSPLVKREGDHFSRDVPLESLVKALGARKVETVDPNDLPACLAAFERARDAQGVSVVICERTCPVHLARETKRPYQVGTYEIDQALCQTCSREDCGLRCQQEISEGFERHLARCRAMETNKSEASLPSKAPCSLKCPLGLCIQGYTGHIAAGEYQAAFEQIIRLVPLPESVCRVCHHPCESVCVRAELDEPVAINELKRFVIDWARRENIAYQPRREPANGMKIAVIGSGPAGLAAAHDLALRGYQVDLLDADHKAGGLLRSGIPAYRLPREALERDIERILSLGINFIGGQRLGVDFQIDGLLAQDYQAVFVAVGAGLGIKLQVEDPAQPDYPEIVDALEYLQQANLGKSAGKPKRVVVIGGGNAALDAARVAKRLSACEVTIAYRRRLEEMPAIKEEIAALEQEGILLRTQLAPHRIEQAGLVCVRTQPGQPDESGRARPVVVADSETLLAADQIIAAIGQTPAPDLFSGGQPVPAADSSGLLQIDPATCQTSIDKVFAGGDLVAGERTVTDAIATGRRAAWGIDSRLRGAKAADWLAVPPPVTQDCPASRTGVSRADRVERQRPKQLEAEQRLDGFAEVVAGLTESQAQTEARRCMVCGTCGNCRICLDLFGCPAFFVKDQQIFIDPELCMGCGVCAELCPNGAIKKVSQPIQAASNEPALGPLEAPAEEMEE
ncbi:MAG: FAD-dependent oxidoreductase [Deltaproteobacteria bacterium]|nr:FAD-dependent oxidoreductase [Deltaproteobacteria bacterium]